MDEESPRQQVKSNLEVGGRLSSKGLFESPKKLPEQEQEPKLDGPNQEIEDLMN